MLLVGVHSTTRQLGQVAHPCPSCRRPTWHLVGRTRRWLTVLFIPLLPFSKSSSVRCNLCGLMRRVPNGHAEALLRPLPLSLSATPPRPTLPPPGALTHR
jgi:hypothetical protein